MLALALAGALAVTGCKDNPGKEKKKPVLLDAGVAAVKVDAGAPAPTTSTTPTTLAADPGGATGTPQWLFSLGGLKEDVSRDVAVDAAGNTYVVGYFSDTIDLGAAGKRTATGKTDAFAIKLDPDGALVWAQTFGGPGEDGAYAVALAPSGELVITGAFSDVLTIGDVKIGAKGSEDIFVAKLAADGAPLWAWSGGGSDSDWGRAVAVDARGSIVVTGAFGMTIDLTGTPIKSAGKYDLFLLSLAAGGEIEWAKTWGNAGNDEGQDLALDGSGNIVLQGSFSQSVTFGGDPLISEGNQDAFLAKYDRAGNHLWSRRFGSPFNENAFGMAIDPAGFIAVTGSFDDEMTVGGTTLKAAGESDMYVARFAGDGTPVWAKRFGGKGQDTGHGLAVDRFGNVIAAGYFKDDIDFGAGAIHTTANTTLDGLLVKLSSKGEVVWSKTFGDRDNDRGWAVAVGADGAVTLTGNYVFALAFADRKTESVHEPAAKIGPPDAFVARFAP